MKFLDELLEGFKREAQDDWIGLWAVPWMIRHAHGNVEPAKIRALSIELIKMMLQNGFVAGDVSKTGFAPWPDRRPGTVIQRIEREWDGLGRDPTIGEIAWFDLPAAS